MSSTLLTLVLGTLLAMEREKRAICEERDLDLAAEPCQHVRVGRPCDCFKTQNSVTCGVPAIDLSAVQINFNTALRPCVLQPVKDHLLTQEASFGGM